MQKLDKIKEVKVAEQSIEVDPRSKTTAKQELERAKLLQAQQLNEQKMEQNEELAELRAGVSLAKTGVQQAAIVTEDD